MDLDNPLHWWNDFSHCSLPLPQSGTDSHSVCVYRGSDPSAGTVCSNIRSPRRRGRFPATSENVGGRQSRLGPDSLLMETMAPAICSGLPQEPQGLFKPCVNKGKLDILLSSAQVIWDVQSSAIHKVAVTLSQDQWCSQVLS